MRKRKIRITIDKQGNYELEALEGFSGASCVEATKNLEIAIGGIVVDEEKKPEYFDPDDSPIRLNLD